MAMDPELEEKIAEVVEAERSLGASQEAAELEQAADEGQGETAAPNAGEEPVEETAEP